MEPAWSSSGLGHKASAHNLLVSELVRLNNDLVAWSRLRRAVDGGYHIVVGTIVRLFEEDVDALLINQLASAIWVLSSCSPVPPSPVLLQLKGMNLTYDEFHKVIFEIAGRHIPYDWPAACTFDKHDFYDPFWGLKKKSPWPRPPKLPMPVAPAPVTTASLPYNFTTTKEIPFMSQAQAALSNKAFETRHYVYGVDVNIMSEIQLIESIKKIESEIEGLKQVKVSSTKVKAKIEELESMLKSVVEVLDAK